MSLFLLKEFAVERLFGRFGSFLFCLILVICAGTPFEAKSKDQFPSATNLQAYLALKVTEIAELRRVGVAEKRIDCPVRLEGTVLWVSPKRDMFGLRDSSGVAVIEIDALGDSIRPETNIVVEGICTVEGERLSLHRRRPLVNNEGIHGMIELSAAMFLKAGKHSIHVPWYNHAPPSGLELCYEGPDIPRQKVPDSALFLPIAGADGSVRWTPGLNYRAYEGEWSLMPDWSQSEAVARGIATNFDCALATRVTNAGLDFTGFLEVPREGVYTFYLSCDDGSQLDIDDQEQRIESVGVGRWPEAIKISARQHLSADQVDQWSMVEGTVIFASEQTGALELELSSGSGRLKIEVAESSGSAAKSYLNHRIRATGIAQSTYTTDGQRVAGKLLTPGLKQIEVLDEPESRGQTQSNATNLPILTTIEEIKHLNREEAQRGYPVKIRGVVTAPRLEGVFVQDSTWSIYVRTTGLVGREKPRIGDYWEIEGTTFAEFAPNILAHRVVRLGLGTFPEPARPSWDQLINGSLDTQFIEVQGIVARVESDSMVLITRTGKIQIGLPEVEPGSLKQYENALIRVRGCVMPGRDIVTQQIKVGRMELCNAAITMDEAALADPFAISLKRTSDLLLFDPRAGALQRVKLSGQVLHQRGEELLLTDGTNGFRATFGSKTQSRFTPGDRVEVVGFAELGGPTPILREALVRSTGHAPLPVPIKLSPDAPPSGQYDSTLVSIESRLASISSERADQVLVLQVGAKGFVARLQNNLGQLRDLQPGTRIELTGVYAGQGDRNSGQDIDSFELLLNSPSDVRVLERPSWWTLQRAMVVVGAMTAIICGALVWITLLRRRVEERSRQLTTEIRRHEHTERQRELEYERARIARDLHDDLGAALTQIRFMSAVESRDGTVPETTRARLAKVSEKSHELVTSLDEIVWAVNPANDSLPSLATYLCQFAEEFFRATPIRCRLDVADFLPTEQLTSEVRHNLYLGVREALNNIAKHSRASEVWLRIQAESQRFRISIEDNGVGFLVPSAGSVGEGLANMRRRMESIGGQFECESRVAEGTICRFELPLKAPEIHV